MTWIRRAPEPPPQHDCPLPLKPRRIIRVTNPDTKKVDEWEDWGEPRAPKGQEGDIWVCDTCLTVWQVVRDPQYDVKVLKWRRAGWFVRWRALAEYNRRLDAGHMPGDWEPVAVDADTPYWSKDDFPD